MKDTEGTKKNLCALSILSGNNLKSMKSNFIYILLLLCIVSCKSNQPDTAQNDPSQIYQLLDRNVALRHDKEWENVHNKYTQLIQQLRHKPEDVKAAMDLTELFMQEARVTGEHGHYYPLALKSIKSVLDNKTLDQNTAFRALSDQASVLLSLHQFAAGKEVALKAIEINPHNAMIHGALVDAHIELGEYNEAVTVADKMVSIRPDIRSYSRISYLREIYEDLDGAIEAMNQAVESGFPGYEETSWARLHLGELYEKQGKIEMAEAQYKMILEQRPQYPFAIAALGALELKRKNFEQAEKLLDEAISYIPEVSFYITKAELKLQTGKKEEANQLTTDILAMLKDDEQAGHTMDLTYAYVYRHLMNDPKTALMYAEKEFVARPNNIEVNQYMADLCIDLGKVDDSKIYLAKSTVQKM